MRKNINLLGKSKKSRPAIKFKFLQKPGWRNSFPIFVLGVWCLAVGGCAHPISSLVRAEADPALTFFKVIEDPKNYQGSIVIWGGIISKVSPATEGLRLLVIQTPLDSRGYPQTEVTQGEFIALTPDSLSRGVYREGKMVTLAGEIEGVEEKQLGPMEYPRPVLRIIQIHPWEEKHFPLTRGNWERGFNSPSSLYEEPLAEPWDVGVKKFFYPY